MTGQIYEDVIYEERDHVATITVNRPDRLNAFRAQTYRGKPVLTYVGTYKLGRIHATHPIAAIRSRRAWAAAASGGISITSMSTSRSTSGSPSCSGRSRWMPRA